ncbi:MAG: NUDIX hydrolase [Asticcacaulis sp.]|uniref:NUDIX hydrolase n=1 Tax=Asticcacaulis sp. TaxID=1872648 RepID=UPI003F7B76A7
MQSGLHLDASHPRPAVGVVCLRGDEVLLIRRGRPPRQGEWSIPGGKVAWGEGLHAAALRELYEETGVRAHIGDLLAVYEIVETDFHYVLIDYIADWTEGEPRAGDDADEARFMSFDEALTLVKQDDLRDVLLRAQNSIYD